MELLSRFGPDTCCLCSRSMTREDAKKDIPGTGLTVHAECYDREIKREFSPPTSPPNKTGTERAA